MNRHVATLFSMLSLVLIAAACIAPAGRQQAPGEGTGQGQSSQTPRRLTVAIQQEPAGFNRDLMLSVRTGGNEQVLHIAHNNLVVVNAKGTRIPQLATELISLEKGTWRVNPDGTMDTTWKIRPNARWHDGTPFTSSDLQFSLTVYKDPDVPNAAGGPVALMESATAPDPQTFIVHWSSTFVDADAALGLIPLPRHVLEDAYRRDKTGFASSPHLTTEFVGLGPYRLTSWDSGVQMEFARFDDYFLGRPPLDTVVVRFLADPNTMVANMLAGTLDAVLPEGVDLDAAAELKRRWEGTGNQVIVGLTGALRNVEIQHRPDLARPSNSWTNRQVRQAFFYATDRRALADVMTQGLAQVADNWIPPTNELYPRVQASIPQYGYDPSRAQQLLAQAGWVRSAGGVLVHQATGERFETELRHSPGAGAEKGVNVVADSWKAVGVEPDINIIPSARSRDREYRSTFPGAGITANTIDSFYTDLLHSKYIANNANRWAGVNRIGYSNPRVDALYDQLTATIAPADRVILHSQLIQEVLTDVARIPLYWELSPVLALKGVKNIGENAENVNTWNMFEWDKD